MLAILQAAACCGFVGAVWCGAWMLDRRFSGRPAPLSPLKGWGDVFGGGER